MKASISRERCPGKVMPAQEMEDAKSVIVCRVLLEEPPLEHCIIHGIVGDGVPIGQETSQRGRSIVVAVSSGLVTLNGEVLSRKHKRLAGVLAWWVPGTRDVVNGLEEVPAE